MAALIDHWRVGSYQLVTSDFILDEVVRAWAKPYWKSRISDDQADRIIALLRREAEVVSMVAPVEHIASHEEDDFVLATALSGDAHYLVTGDKELSALGTVQEVRILAPQTMLELLNKEAVPGGG
jgi:putative PIN family toxin of toxin-antitoxin system